MSTVTPSRLRGVVSRILPTRPTYAQRTGLTRSELFDTLANDRRRAVIRLIDDGAHTIRQLSERIAREESGEDYNRSEYKCVYVSLYQTNLEVLAERDVVEVENDLVLPGPNHAVFSELLELAE